ncbi:MAG: nuclear transport factor 2 family protein [Anaeromyxobacteraceae bacterium]
MAAHELEVLEANQAFYRAFSRKDAAAMDLLWAEAHPVACVHPGWDVLDGREDVMGSWEAILDGDGAPQVAVSLAQAHVLGEVAFVTCHEVVDGGRLAATNVFVREAGRWRLVHHQASPIAPGQERDLPPPGPAN